LTVAHKKSAWDNRPQEGNNDGAAICDTGSFERR
jgi:hypothetical protein